MSYFLSNIPYLSHSSKFAPYLLSSKSNWWRMLNIIWAYQTSKLSLAIDAYMISSFKSIHSDFQFHPFDMHYNYHNHSN